MDGKVYQRRNGSFYVKPEEFVSSDAGQELLKRFINAQVSESEEDRPQAQDRSVPPVDSSSTDEPPSAS